MVKKFIEDVKKFIKKVYASEDNQSIAPLGVGGVFLIFAIIFTIIIFNTSVDVITNVFRWHFTLLFFSMSLFMTSLYFFQNKKNENKFKIIKHIFFYISLVFLAVVFLPIALTLYFLKLIKFEGVVQDSPIYLISIFIPMLISMFIGVFLFFIIKFKIIWLEPITISIFLAFLCWIFFSRFIVFLFCKFSKRKITRERYLAIKKDLYVIIFVIITFAAILTHCINWSFITSDIITMELVKGFSSSFALYIAFDRLYGKWDKANKDFEKQITAEK